MTDGRIKSLSFFHVQHWHRRCKICARTYLPQDERLKQSQRSVQLAPSRLCVGRTQRAREVDEEPRSGHRPSLRAARARCMERETHGGLWSVVGRPETSRTVGKKTHRQREAGGMKGKCACMAYGDGVVASPPNSLLSLALAPSPSAFPVPLDALRIFLAPGGTLRAEQPPRHLALSRRRSQFNKKSGPWIVAVVLARR